MQMSLFPKQNWTHRLGYQGKRMGGGIVRDLGIIMHMLLYLKCITSNVLLYSTGNYANVMWQLRCEGSLGEIDTCIGMIESLHCSPESITILLIGYNPI